MKTKNMLQTLALPALLLSTLNSQLSTVLAQGTAFTYQGRLTDNGSPANGNYDLRIYLRDAATVGNPVGPTNTLAPVAVSNGLFTVTLDFGNQFPDADRWLELGVRTNGGGAFTTLSPRQPLTATPYAIAAGNLAGTVAATQLTGTLPDARLSANVSLFGASVESAEIADGTITSADMNAASFNNTFWKTDGNSGTAAQFDFIGTTDNQPLQFRVNNARVLRFEPSFFSPRLVGGHPGNAVAADADGAVIAGGGTSSQVNFAGAGYTFIGGGVGNTNNGGGTFIGGGLRNLIESEAFHSVVVGGLDNTIASNAFRATIGGGDRTHIGTGAHYSVISGGHSNSIANGSLASVINGGRFNHIGTNSSFCAIGGGLQNTIADEAIAAIIPGGIECFAANYALAAGRGAKANHTGAFVWADASSPEFASTGFNQFLVRAVGGVGINKNNPATALDVTGIVTATGFSGPGSGLTLLNAANLTSGTLADARLSSNVALRNQNNTFSVSQSVPTGSAAAPGLSLNSDSDTGLFSPSANTLALATGGAEWVRITASGNVGIGVANPVAPLHVHTPVNVDVSLRLTSGGSWPLVLNQSGSSVFSITNGGQGQLFIPANGNVGIGTNNPSQRLHVIGNILATGTVTGSSDRNVKENFAPVDAQTVLEKVARLDIQRWNYLGENTPHLGPVAQDFYAAFGVGSDDRHISMVDADGVALAAIQGLNQKVEHQQTQLEQKQTEIAELSRTVNELKQLVQALNHQINGGAK